MIRYNQSVIDWFLEQQLSSDPVNNCIILYFTIILSLFVIVSEPVNILVYWPGPVNILFSSGFYPNSFFVLDM